MDRVAALLQDSRILAAKAAYEELYSNDNSHPIRQSQISSSLNSLSTSSSPSAATSTALPSHVIQQMYDRSKEVEEALVLASSKNENWILATNLLGVTTHYMLDGDGDLLVRMESTQYNIPLMEQLSVVYEVALFNKWIPFCTESSLISRLNHVEVISYSCISALGVSRDVVVHSYGVDCLYENGSIVVIGKSIDSYPGLDIPPVKGFFSRRAALQFKAVVTPFSPTSGHMIVVAKIDPKLALPTSVINFTTKQIAGFFLVMIHQQAREIETNEDSPYRECIRNNPEFYLHWILPKLRKYINHNGWKQPDIACLGEAGIYRDTDTLAELNCKEDTPQREENDLLTQAPSSNPSYYPYIEGSLYKKGNGIISSVWSYRHFELDIREQTLRWYKFTSSSKKNSSKIHRGEISVVYAVAELLTDKQKKKKYSKVLTGEVFVLKYYQTPPDGPSKLSSPSESPLEMYLSAPCLQEAYHWMTHLNISSKIHLQAERPALSVSSISSSTIPDGAISLGEIPSAGETADTPPSLLQKSPSLFLLLIYLLPLSIFVFPLHLQGYIALLFIYTTPFLSSFLSSPPPLISPLHLKQE